MKEKNDLRNKYLEIRKNLVDKDKKSFVIFDKIIKDKDYINAKVIGLYKSLSSEVNTDKLLEYSLEVGKVVLLPRVVENEIKFYRYNLNDSLEKSKFGVLEPLESSNDYSIDLVIVPGVAFTIDGNRLGFGKGYYDRFLANKNIKTIGICFKEQICDYIPVNENDIKINKIIHD